MPTFNSQFFGASGGGVPQWNPVEKPNFIQAGKDVSPSVYIVSVDMTFTVDDVVQAKRDTAIYFNKNTNRWRVVGGVSEKDRGWFVSLSALQSAVPNPSIGDYAYVNATGTYYLYASTGWLNSNKSTPPNALTTADVEDSLASQSPSSVLSANQGYVLDQKKVDKVVGYSLTKNDFTDALKTKLDGIQAGAEVNVQADWNQTVITSDDFIKNKPSIYTQSETYNKSEIDSKDSLKIDLAQKGAVNGVATLDNSGKIPLSQLPDSGVSYYENIGNFPINGSENVLYVAKSTNIGYIWKTTTNEYKELGDINILKQSDIVTNLTDSSTNKVASASTVKTLQDTKVDVVSGKQLSTEDYTTAEKTKLANIQDGAEVNVQADWNQTVTTSDDFIKNKPLIYTQSQVDTIAGQKINRVLASENFIPKFDNTGNLVSTGKLTTDFEPADVNILKTSDIINDLSGGTVGNNRQVLEASQGKILKDQIDTKEPTITAGTSSQYWRGDKTFQILNQNAVGISNNFITNVSQENILSSKATPSDSGTQTEVVLRVGKTDTPATRGADLKIQSGVGTDGGGSILLQSSVKPDSFVNINNGATATSAGTSPFVFTHDGGSAANLNRLMLIQFVCPSSTSATAVSYGGTSATLHSRRQGSTLAIETWFIKNAPVGTNQVSITLQNPQIISVRAQNFYNVDQTTPLATIVAGSNDNQVTSASLTSNATSVGQIVVDFVGFYGSNVTASATASQVNIWDGSTGNQQKAKGGYKIVSGASTTMSYSFSSGTPYVMQLIAINKVSGTSVGTPITLAEVHDQGLSANQFITQSAHYDSGGTITLTPQSPSKMYFTNSSTACAVYFPNALRLKVGTVFEINNINCQQVTTVNFSNVQLDVIVGGNSVRYELKDNSTQAGVWVKSLYASQYYVADYVSQRRGVAFGIAPLNASGIVEAQYLPASSNPWSVGDYKMSGIISDHNGFLVCDGRTISRTTYSALFAIIGTSFGNGDGSTTFHLPDPRGRAIAASGLGAGLTARTLGTSLGAETHTLAISEMPNHNHTVTGYVRTDYDANDVFSNFNGLDTGANNYASTFVGGGQPHNNMQPTLFIGNLFIYAGV